MDEHRQSDARASGSAPASTTHERAVTKEDNGELQEDVVPKDALDADDARTDEASEESFPASDAPSAWSGGEDGAGTARGGAGRLVERSPAPEVPEREDPAQPVPRTLPREGGAGAGRAG